MTSVLVLVSFALVLVALMLLILGVLSTDGLALIYLSILCSVGAGVVLYLATRPGVAKPGAKPVVSGLTPPLLSTGAEEGDLLASRSADTITMATVASGRDSVAVPSPLSDAGGAVDADQPFFPSPTTTISRLPRFCPCSRSCTTTSSTPWSPTSARPRNALPS